MPDASGTSAREKRRINSRAGAVIPAIALPARTLQLIRIAGATMSAKKNKILVTGKMEVKFRRAATCSLQADMGPTIIAAVAKAANTNAKPNAAMSSRCEKRPTEERRGSRTISRPGGVAITPTLSCGQARTQSRQNVQSKLPDLRGR